MEENATNMTEVEEIETVDEDDEVTENSNGGAFVAGIVGGFLAYALVSGAKKLAAFICTKLEARRNNVPNDVVEVEVIDTDEQAGSDEENPNK